MVQRDADHLGESALAFGGLLLMALQVAVYLRDQLQVVLSHTLRLSEDAV